LGVERTQRGRRPWAVHDPIWTCKASGWDFVYTLTDGSFSRICTELGVRIR